MRIDIAEKKANLCKLTCEEGRLLAVVVPRNDPSYHALQCSCQLPSSSSDLSMTEKTLLGHNGCDSVSESSINCSEDVIPNPRLIFLLETDVICIGLTLEKH
jgi:hypothetical protein